VKIPITDTARRPCDALVRRLAGAGVKLNVTALMTLEQVSRIAPCLADGPSAFISLFAGRIADTGIDPVPIVAQAVRLLRKYPNIELIWASPRELLNIYHAESAGCHIITVTNDVLKKLPIIGRDLAEYSLDTVKMFYEDGRKAGYTLVKPTPVEIYTFYSRNSIRDSARLFAADDGAKVAQKMSKNSGAT
jgi:transaldolase